MKQESSLVDRAKDRAKSLSEQGASNGAKLAAGVTEAAKHRASSATEAVKEAVKDKAGEALDAAKDRTGEMAHGARSAAADLVSQGSRQVGSRVKTAGEGVHDVEDVLRKRGLGKVADVTGQAADSIESLGSHLLQVGAESRWSRAKSFAARYRWALAAAGVVVGVAAGWWLKASKRDIEAQEADAQEADDSAKRLFRRLL